MSEWVNSIDLCIALGVLLGLISAVFCVAVGVLTGDLVEIARKQANREKAGEMTKLADHVIVDIDEVIGFGTIKMSTATHNALKSELEEKETGHHVGPIALIHSMRAATNERLARDEAERRYKEEFGRSNPNALEYYRSLPEHPAIENQPPVAEAPVEEHHEG